MNIQVGKTYNIRDGGTIFVQQDTFRGTHENDSFHDKFTRFRCVTETGEVMFYSERGIAAYSGETPNPSHSVTSEVH